MHQDAWCLLHWKFFAHLCSIERCFSLCCLKVASAWLEDLEAGRLRTFCAWHPKVETDRHSLPGGWCSEDCWGQKRTQHLRCCVPKFVFYRTEDLPADAASRRRPKKKKIREVEVRKREVDHMQTLGHKKSTDFCTFWMIVLLRHQILQRSLRHGHVRAMNF